MNSWLKIGVPVLAAVLLVISAVSITIAATSDKIPNQVAASYTAGTTPDNGVAKASCPNCLTCNQAAGGDQGTTANPVCIPQGKQGSCCTGTTQGTVSSQTYRGSCCGAR